MPPPNSRDVPSFATAGIRRGTRARCCLAGTTAAVFRRGFNPVYTWLADRVITSGEAIRALLGYMPEHDCLPPDVTATEFVTHLGRISGLPQFVTVRGGAYFFLPSLRALRYFAEAGNAQP